MKIINDLSNSDYTTSHGNQLKTRVSDIWYKFDNLGYESASEFFVSELLKCSNISNFVQYSLCNVKVGGIEHIGCCSKNFLDDDSVLITADRLFKLNLGTHYVSKYTKLSPRDRIKYFIDHLSEITRIKNLGEQITKLIEFDAFILNDDRHLNNIAFIKRARSYELAPIFDNGSSFLSNLKLFPLDKNILGLIPLVEAKPFSSLFEEQIDLLEENYGKQLFFKINDDIIDKSISQISVYYSNEIADRIKKIYNFQYAKYRNYFKDYSFEQEVDFHG